jgi:hypothetical protein
MTKDKPLKIDSSLLESAAIDLARKDFSFFVRFIKKDFDATWFHNHIMEALMTLYSDVDSKKLMISMPPQHGKSTLATQLYPAYLLGVNPNLKIVIASYTADLASRFNREVQKIIDSPEYRKIFPDTKIAKPRSGEAIRNNDMFEVINNAGYLKSVGTGGSLTGFSVDVLICDDLIKDYSEAKSLNVRETVWDWYTSVAESRLQNNGKQLLIATRWDNDDPLGRAGKRDNDWNTITLPALRESLDDGRYYDKREVGEALWEDRQSADRLIRIKESSPIIFNSLYQQDPRPATESLVYPDWQECEVFPDNDDVFYGMDFGFTNDPTACIKMVKIGDNIYLDELFYATKMTNKDIANSLKKLNVDPYSEIFADSAEPKSIADLRASFNVKPQKKGKGSILAGINKLKEYRVFYTKRSKNIATEVKNYQWIMQNGESTNVPIDTYNHCLDAIRCAMFTKYGKERKWYVI